QALLTTFLDGDPHLGQTVAEPGQIQHEPLLLHAHGRLATGDQPARIRPLTHVALTLIADQRSDRTRPPSALSAVVQAHTSTRPHDLPANGLTELDWPRMLPLADQARQLRLVTLPEEPGEQQAAGVHGQPRSSCTAPAARRT